MIYPQNFEQKIGFDSIRHLLKGKCLSTLGEERVDEMAFSEKYEEINERLEQVMEFIRIIQEEDEFPDQYFFDVRPSLKRIRIEGMYLDEQELFDLRRSLETIRDIVRFLTRTTEDEEMEESTSPYPALKRLAGDIIVFPQLITRINNILDKFGKIKDNASSELLRIRRELTSTTGSISRSLNAILRNAQSEGYVDKDVTPTMRDGRLVIPVAPGLKRKIKKHLNPRLDIQGILLTMYDKRNNLTQQVEKDVRKFLGKDVFETVIPRNIKVSEAPSFGQPAIIYDYKCSGSMAYIYLAKEILQRAKVIEFC